MALNRKGGKWPGGYVSLAPDGTKTYVIEREVRGTRFHISTRCHEIRAAIKHLERFEADPTGYKTIGILGTRDATGLYLTKALVMEFHDWMLTRPKPASRHHANDMAHRLLEWLEDLPPVDLRRLTLRDHIRPALAKRTTNRKHRIIALKSFFAWMRKEKMVIERREDPTLDLPVPQAEPEKHKRRKAVAIDEVRKVIAAMSGAHRDCLVVLAGLGIHISELERFVRHPDSQLTAGRGDVLAVLQTRHKSGAWTRIPITDPEVWAAALRLQARGEVPRRLFDHVKAACRAAGVPEFGPGVMRHSVATWAIEAGTPPDVVAEFLHHRDKRTTLRFYADVGVPVATPKLPKLL